MNTIATLAHPYPLIRGGGLFLICVGLGFLLSWMVPRYWLQFMIGGGVAGLIASGLSALLPKIGHISWVHIAGLVGSLVLEMGLIYLVISRLKDADQRTVTLWILFVVGLHFIPMGIAHGPMITILGVVTAINAGVGLWLARGASLRALGILDALLKLAFGLVMLLAYPALTFT